MTKKRSTSSKKAGRDMVEINVTGNNNAVATHGGKATVAITPAVQQEWQAWREQMEREIKALKDLPAADQAMLTQNVQEVVKEAEKGEKADESRIERLINTLTAMAPDILDVVVTTLQNPLAGIGLVIKKIGEKAKISKAA